MSTSEPPSSGFDWAYRDFLTSMMVVFMAMAAFALLIVVAKPQPKNDAQVGQMLFELEWTPGVDADVDLWVESPGDTSVGYLRLAGMICNLLRDDLGHSGDPVSRNMELTACRAKPDGVWIANAVLYSSHDKQFPVEATVKAVMSGPNGTMMIAKRTLTLTHEGDEQTAFRFTLKDGDLVNDSINDLPAKLWIRPGQSQ